MNDAAAAKAWEAHTAAMRAAHPWIQGTIEGRGNFIEGFKAGAEWARKQALREAEDAVRGYVREYDITQRAEYEIRGLMPEGDNTNE